MTKTDALKKIAAELKGIDPVDLTHAERKILAILRQQKGAR